MISGFGFNKFMTMLVGLPSGAIQIISVWVTALAMRWTRNLRSFWGFIMVLIPLIGSILLLTLPKSEKWGIVVATWLAACTSNLMLITTSLIASNVKGNTKKSAVSSIFFIGYSTGCISGPQLWQAVDAPRYTKGCISSIASWVLLLIVFTFNYFYLRHQNRKREALGFGTDNKIVVEVERAKKTEELVGVEVDSDLTDRQDLRFRYTS